MANDHLTPEARAALERARKPADDAANAASAKVSAILSPDRFVTPCELPTPREREILTILIEECAEVQQRATKLLRFGRDEVQPGQPHSNMVRLSQEIGDLQAILTLAEDARLVSRDIAGKQAPIKFAKLEQFMQSSP